MNNYLITFLVILLLQAVSSAQENPKNGIGLSYDFIHSWAKSYNFQKNARGSTYDLSNGVTIDYERIIKEKFFIRFKIGYYFLENNINFPGKFTIIDHSMNRIGRATLDAVPIGLNAGIMHHLSSRWVISFHLGLNSYLLYRPIPSGYTVDLNQYLQTMEDVRIESFISSGADLMSTDFIHSYEIGHALSYTISRTYAISLFLNNQLRIGFRPYFNYEMVVYSIGLEGDEALLDTASSNLSSLFFTSLGIRYGF